MKTNQKAFTLVELAIVITIIGLLIGGVLKGQELLENARMTSSASQLKSFTSASITFKDIYKALPGDMLAPGNFLQNCTTAPCNIAGNGNGMIGIDSTSFGDENFNYWAHMKASNLISGIDHSSTSVWNGTWIQSASPPFPISARMLPIYLSPTGGISPAGYYWHSVSNTGTYDIAVNLIAKYDLKTDDGRPKTGDVQAHPHCTLASGGQTYDPNIKTLCHMLVYAGF